ncbi:glucosyltransferase domain-containing protein [Pantoea ananatis]
MAGVLGRPMADILMKILSASGHYNLDLFPYTMIASCLFIGAASLMLSKHLVKMDVPNEKLVAALPIFNPFFLQNIAYRYDSLACPSLFSCCGRLYLQQQQSDTRIFS